jgi:AraC-like DNA-binding protein
MMLVRRSLLLVEISPEMDRLVADLPESRFASLALSWSSLDTALRKAQPNSILVVEPFDPVSSSTTFARMEALRELLRRAPVIPVVAVARHPENNAEMYASLLQEGLTEWLDLGREACAFAVERRFRHAASVSVQKLLDRALSTPLSSRTRALLGEACEVAASGGRMPDLAHSFGVAERTVSRWLFRAELPPPRRLLAWIRLLLAADYLDAGQYTLESIARGTGYSSGASLKTALRNMLGATPKELRQRGAFRTVADGFAGELRAIREERRAAGRPPRTWLN